MTISSKIKLISSILVLAFELLASVSLRAAPTNSDETLQAATQAARQAAFSGHRSEARHLCQTILQTDPNQNEARILLARLFAWDDDYDQARVQLETVLRNKPASTDARSALMDVEIWSDHPQRALDVADQGIALDPASATLLLKKARVLRSLHRIDEAQAAAERAAEADPQSTDASEFLTALKQSDPKYKISLSYTRDDFNQGFDPWQIYSLSASRRFAFGSVIARMNQATRFQTHGTQFEIDAYPHLRDGTYLYLNVGKSSASIFPQERYGAELYQSLGFGWETSFGLRHLLFSGSTVNIWTGTFAKYLGNYYFLLRGNLIPDASGNSLSSTLQIRRYFGDENYLALSMGGGKSLSFGESTTDVLSLRAQHAGLDLYHNLTRLWYGSAGISFESQEIRPGTFRRDRTISLGAERRF